jgi:hypothetical protein
MGVEAHRDRIFGAGVGDADDGPGDEIIGLDGRQEDDVIFRSILASP